MKKKFDFKILVIIVLAIVWIIMCIAYVKGRNTSNYSGKTFDRSSKFDSNFTFDDSTASDSSSTTKASTISNTSTETTISKTCEIESALTENLELHATYYLEESYIKTNQLIKSGEKILKYTNGKYLTAPYDCVIIKSNIPDEGEEITNEHYVQISSANNLMVELNVDETKVSNFSIGQEATIEVAAYEDKKITGNITSISNVASNGKFTIKVEFENDSDIMLGMTANVTI